MRRDGKEVWKEFQAGRTMWTKTPHANKLGESTNNSVLRGICSLIGDQKQVRLQGKIWPYYKKTVNPYYLSLK